MPLHIDEAWEYWEPDPEIAEVLAMSGAFRLPLDAVTDIRLWKAEAEGMRFGSGDPNAFWPRLARERPAAGNRGRLGWVECRGCGRPLEQDRASREYCSLSCRPTGRKRELPDKVCQQCGDAFRPRTADDVYCGWRCFVRSLRKPAEAPAGGCKNCGGEVPPSASRNQKAVRLFCSPKCKRNWANRAMRRRRSEREDVA